MGLLHLYFFPYTNPDRHLLPPNPTVSLLDKTVVYLCVAFFAVAHKSFHFSHRLQRKADCSWYDDLRLC